MSEDIAISIKDVEKSFRLPNEHNGIKQYAVNTFRRKDEKVRGYEDQRVLKGVSFNIKKGEFFGIVGRNGSGKSTLLKLIAGIYTPEKGSITVNGTLIPFIELGVGFNPELTGRENAFLNGALIGFSHTEMEAMYDEIVEFAELERFMDQKLKNYSSGMQVRLAFSIAIRAKSDILVLDEVLAVGDEAFQRKCDAYFQEIKKDTTKTIVLVTHSMASMRKYCDRAVLIHSGEITVSGSPEDVANQYTEENFDTARDNEPALNGHEVGLSERVPMFKVTPVSKTVLTSQEDFRFKVSYQITDDTPVNIKFSILDEGRGGYPLIQNGAAAIAKKGENSLTYTFPLSLYNDGEFVVSAVLDEEETNTRIAFTSDKNSLRFAIRNTEQDGGYSLLQRGGDYYGKWDNDWPEFSQLRKSS